MEHVSIWGTPFPAILNQKNSTGSAGGAKNSQNGGILVPPKMGDVRDLEKDFFKMTTFISFVMIIPVLIYTILLSSIFGRITANGKGRERGCSR